MKTLMLTLLILVSTTHTYAYDPVGDANPPNLDGMTDAAHAGMKEGLANAPQELRTITCSNRNISLTIKRSEQDDVRASYNRESGLIRFLKFKAGPILLTKNDLKIAEIEEVQEQFGRRLEEVYKIKFNKVCTLKLNYMPFTMRSIFTRGLDESAFVEITGMGCGDRLVKTKLTCVGS
ncbi:MAG: hypothetical protein AB7O96_07375 [Pseudobdellovibrionaceae bacterium]